MTIINLRHTRKRGAVFVGRPSPLGNRFVIGQDGSRAEVIAKYRVWLLEEIRHRKTTGAATWAALVALRDRVLAGEDLTLACFCAPEACHAEVIREVVLALAERVRERR